MDLLVGVLGFITSPARWSGSDSIPSRTGEHLLLSAVALALACLIALPVGVVLGHAGRGGLFAQSVANIGRALPSMALLAFSLPVAFALGLGLGFWPTLFAMVPLGIPPILTSSYVAIRGVDRDAVEAARAMGMTTWQVLRCVELPLAVPLIISGIRNGGVAIVATATLGALVAGGGLGRFIVDGLALQQYDRLVVGALLVALLAVGTEVSLGWLARRLQSPGVRRGEPLRVAPTDV